MKQKHKKIRTNKKLLTFLSFILGVIITVSVLNNDSQATQYAHAADTTPPTASIITPNGGGTYPSKSTISISWNATDDSNDADMIIDLYYSIDDVNYSPIPFASNLKNEATGYFSPTQVASSGTGNGQFNNGPTDIVVANDGTFFAADPGNNRIQKFDASGNYLSEFKIYLYLTGADVQSIDLDNAGNIYAVDVNLNKVINYDPLGNQTASIINNINSPREIAIDKITGDIYVTNTSTNEIWKHDSSGNLLKKFGGSGVGNGQFGGIKGIDIDINGNIYAIDTNNRVQKFDSDGNFILSFGNTGTGNGQFSNPQFIEISNNSIVYVSDSTRVQKFDSSGNFLSSISIVGNSGGGLGMSSNGTIYVGDNTIGQENISIHAPQTVNSGGTFEWKIPENNTSQAKIKIIATDQATNSSQDQSDSTFTITPTYRVSNISPAQNAINISKSTNITITLNENVDQTTVNQSNILIYESKKTINGTYSTNGSVITFDPNNDFKPGSNVQVVVTSNVLSNNAKPIQRFVGHFDIAPTAGKNSFLPKTEYQANNAQRVYNGDLDNDGDIDIIVADINSTIKVFENDGTGVFSNTNTYTTSIGLDRSINLADINNDGYLDMVVSSIYSTQIIIFINNQDGTFASPVNYTLPYTYSPYDIDLGDIDGDGDMDIIVVTAGSAYIQVLKNNGNGIFSDILTFQFDSINKSYRKIILRDVENDGDLDAIIQSDKASVKYISIIRNDGKGIFGPEEGYLIQSTGYRFAFQIADFNADSFPDILFGAGDRLYVSLNKGDGTFLTATEYITPNTGNVIYSASVADINADGSLDILAVGQNSFTVHVLLNNGSGTFTFSSTISTGSFNMPRDITTADFNGDGAIDIATANSSPGTLGVFLASAFPQNLFVNDSDASLGTTNPTGITDPTPVFSAICNNLSNTTSILNKYQIQISTVSDFSSTVYDSGSGGTSMTDCPHNQRSQNIEPNTISLNQDGSLYYWRIRFWDVDGYVNAWSDATGVSSTFSMYDPTAPIIDTIAGTGIQTGSIDGPGGNIDDDLKDGGLAINATFDEPYDIAIDSQGNIFITDYANNLIRKIDATTQNISTIAGRLGDSSYNPGENGGPAIVASIGNPAAIAIDSSDNIYIADTFNDIIRVIYANGTIDLYAGDPGNGGYSGDGGTAVSAQLNNPQSLVVDSNDNLYIAEYSNYIIRKIDANTKIITTITGIPGDSTYNPSDNGGPALGATAGKPRSLAIDANDNIYYGVRSNGFIRKIEAGTGNIILIAGDGTDVYTPGSDDGILAVSAGIDEPRTSLAVDADGNVYFPEYYDDVIRKIDVSTGIVDVFVGDGTSAYKGDGGEAIRAGLDQPRGMLFDASGNFIFVDSRHNVIRKVTFPTTETATQGSSRRRIYSNTTNETTTADEEQVIEDKSTSVRKEESKLHEVSQDKAPTVDKHVISYEQWEKITILFAWMDQNKEKDYELYGRSKRIDKKYQRYFLLKSSFYTIGKALNLADGYSLRKPEQIKALTIIEILKLLTIYFSECHDKKTIDKVTSFDTPKIWKWFSGYSALLGDLIEKDYEIWEPPSWIYMPKLILKRLTENNCPEIYLDKIDKK